MIKDCNNCANQTREWVLDVLEWDCPIADDMTDEEYKQAQDNNCPYWEAIE